MPRALEVISKLDRQFASIDEWDNVTTGSGFEGNQRFHSSRVWESPCRLQAASAWTSSGPPLLGAPGILWGILFEGLPPLEWLNMVLLAGFDIVFTLFSFKMGMDEQHYENI